MLIRSNVNISVRRIFSLLAILLRAFEGDMRELERDNTMDNDHEEGLNSVLSGVESSLSVSDYLRFFSSSCNFIA